MKLVLASLFLLLGISCKQSSKEVKNEEPTPKEVAVDMMAKYPQDLAKVFEAHGGLANWKNKRLITFELPKGEHTERHTIDLYSRDEKITMPGVSMGSKGSDIWLLDEAGTYKGDAVFYHNLMFYFYSMPFVLADRGIVYEEAEPLAFEGKMYPGIRIRYQDGVGLSAKDEYFLHYDPETFQMAWLGYTVTFRTGERSDNVRWIRYNDWMSVDEVLLPSSITWHQYEGRTIKEPRDPVVFQKVSLSAEAPAPDFFDMPEGAKIVNGKQAGI